MAGSNKESSVPNDVKNYIRSVLLSKPKGSDLDRLPKDYKQLVGERLDYRKYGAKNLPQFLNMMPDAVRLVQTNGSSKVYGIPDSNSYQTISMKMATKALNQLPKSSQVEVEQPHKSNKSKGGGNMGKPWCNKSPKGNKKQMSDSVVADDVDLDHPLIKKWLVELEEDMIGRFSITVKDSPTITSDGLREDFSKYGKVKEVNSAVKGLHFVRFGSKSEALRAMYHLRDKYEMNAAKNKKPRRQVTQKSETETSAVKMTTAACGSTKYSGLNHTAGNENSDTLEPVAGMDVCVENLPPNICKTDIGELLYIANIPADVVISYEVFSKEEKSFGYLRVKNMINACQVMQGLKGVTWRGHKITAKMPDHVTAPAAAADAGPRRKVMLRSANTVSARLGPVVASVTNGNKSDEEDGEDERMPELEASTFEDDDALVRRKYTTAEEEEEYDDDDDDDDDAEMPELEPIPTASGMDVDPEQTKNNGAGKPVLTVKNFHEKTTDDEYDQSSYPKEIKFKGGGTSLSNFYVSSLSIWNRTFRSAEHAYQYFKATVMGDLGAAAEILKAESPAAAKGIGNRVTLDHTWLAHRDRIMRSILEAKAQQSAEFCHELLATGSHTLVENTSHDYWGRGRRGDGKNMLGNMLMDVRSQLWDLKCHS